ncbi:MAG: photosystem P840 reaction-center cytochrome c-551 [Candidatus Electrothrix aestuarii]|uniref:Photosystem P840 reaction-center cytochrome c-551 n=1 Tax=Candidatus Electrothrix aestuarii TaxID=3062594 RepID=A0AAU8LRZ7_9BACT|nr:photosystem P840 reaction-center cytochrome c-551 [Candidatus Electrothrix aestuarii]WPD21810.1 MAG: photosystem P840 reaction-center cytochrome c-551 [Candidatus Electrothrix sp. GW3-3]
MNPIITSLAGLAATLTGACAMLLMLELRGNPRKDSKANQRLIMAHRVTGYIFIALFLVILAVMISKAGSYSEEFSPRTILHITLALLVIPLLGIKILIIRRFRRFEKQIPGLGLAVFLALFLLNSMTAGYYFLHQSDIGKLSLSEEDAAVLDEKKGQKLVAQKCGKCHTLERVFKALKTDKGWEETVQRMLSFDAPNISEAQGKQILNYLISQQHRREKLAAEAASTREKIGKNLIEQKCSFCHGLDRIYMAQKNHDGWVKIIENMVEYSEQEHFLTQQEKEAVIEFLSNRKPSQVQSPTELDKAKTEE